MADMKAHLKSAAWTEAEVIAIGGGMYLGARFLPDEKIFKTKFAQNPAWFQGARTGAPFLVKWSGGIKAAGAVMLSTYVSNPWLKLALVGVAIQGSYQQFRVLTFNSQSMLFRMPQIGATTKELELDAELKQLAQKNRGMSGMSDTGDRYQSSVGNNNFADPGDRYQSSVGNNKGVYDENEFPLNSNDGTGAY